ncbi:PrsW family intramembrane metalloprotease [Treponema sp. OMZ 840]|uniref:PrsW family glutamic-type intramembrane protease n=1 Tax=Treponema sp. OMZ 840 TaxID=244313 RepID=UPI003D8D93FF
MELYITLILCFLPLAAGILFSLLKVPSFGPVQAVWAVAAGFASLVPIILIQFVIKRNFDFAPTSLAAVFISALVFNGFIEETAKAAFLFLLPVKTAHPSSFFASALIAGTAVGSFEALIYCIAGTNYSVIRLFTAVVLHALCSALSCIFIRTKLQGAPRIAAFVSAVFCHGIYNFFAGFTGFLWWFSVLAIFFALIRLRYYYTDVFFK